MPARSPCRTRGGKTATKYHTPRCILVPALREELEVLVPEDRGPGRAWKAGSPVEQTPDAPAAAPIRIGYARCSTATQELQSQLNALEPVCKRISEKISTRVKTRPELEKALKLAYDIKEAAPDQEVILTVHELKRLARNAAELMTLSGKLQDAGVQLELLTGPLTGITGHGRHVLRRARGRRPVPEIAKKLTIKTGKNKDQHPSVASVYRALAEAERHDDGERSEAEDLPPTPARTRIRRPGDPLTAEELALRERIIAPRLNDPDLELDPS
ncbi:recombinase family protein [Streptomyces maoxianensis]|uniref:Recombinase family protein n=1 Tax=Streptomyces maoxianensis TaxID=1459942 RepID=A0ABV9FZ53_9ACTN